MATQQGAGEGEFEDVRLEEGNGASDSNGVADAGGVSAAGADLRSGDGSAYGNGVSGPSDSTASGGDRSGEASGNDAQPSSSSTGGGGSVNAAPIIGGSIVGDVLYSIATGEEEGKSRARILAFAAKRYQNAVEKNPRDYDALYNWALVLQESADNCGPDAGLQGKDSLLEDACKKYQAATDLCSTLHEAFYNWAIAISDRAKIRGRTAEAEALWKQACDKYERAVQLNWDSPQALNNWGLALQELGTIVPAKEKRTVIRKAIHKFRAAIRLRFDFHRAIYNLGTVLYGLAEDTAKSEKRNAPGHPPQQPPVSAEIYSQSAVYIASAHALKSDYPVYRNALRLVRTMLPLPYLKGGYLTVPPFGDSFAPHAEWRRRWFVLDHENLKEGKKPEPRQSAMQLHAARRSSSNPSAAAGATTGAAAAAAQIAPTASITFPVPSGGDGAGSSVETSAGDAITYEPKTSTAISAAASARSSLAATAASGGVDLTVPQQEEPPPVHIAVEDILSVEACADLSLPKGGGIVLGTASGPFYMVADDWEAMDAWVDAIRLVYTVYVRGKNEEMAAVLAG